MGYTSASRIEKGAKYLLTLLVMESPIHYSRFYDGEEETSRKLSEALGIEEKDRAWYCAEHIIDLAVYELSEQGIVETEELDARLVDGERDYAIFLTARGKKLDLAKTNLKFWDAE